MEELNQILSDVLSDKLYQIIISNPREKLDSFKIKIRPVLLRNTLMYQETVWKGTKVYHDNYDKDSMLSRMMYYMEYNFKQLEAEAIDKKITVLVSKKGKITIKQQCRQASGETVEPELSHNRIKQYILEEGKPVPFMVDLGVQTPEGKVVRSKYDKFKQINRYLELIEDIMPTLSDKEQIHIIDFGCGKSYLTFALYYYLHELSKRKVTITGLDLKEEVIEHCNQLAQKYGYDSLYFLKGDIRNFNEADSVDMVVTLHACDTATDYALEKAVQWGARIIFSVPCCQHEVNGQIHNDLLEPVLKYGLIRERIAALVTDAIRANLLEQKGYETQIVEFIDMEHTPKNILIRAVKRENSAVQSDAGIKAVTDFLQIETTLQKLL